MAAGLGRRGEVCGALTAGIMAVGVLIGRRKLDEREAMGECMKVAREVIERFEKELGSMRCFNVQERVFGRSYDLNDMDDRQAFEEAGGHDTEGCPRVVYHGAKIAADVVLRLQGR